MGFYDVTIAVIGFDMVKGEVSVNSSKSVVLSLEWLRKTHWNFMIKFGVYKAMPAREFTKMIPFRKLSRGIKTSHG